MRQLINGHFERQRDLTGRHFDKVMLYRIFLWSVLVQVMLMYLSTLDFDSQRVTNMIQRFSDGMMVVITGTLSALYILMRATTDGRTRETDKLPQGGKDEPKP